MLRDSLAYNKPINFFETGSEGLGIECGDGFNGPPRCDYCGANLRASCKSHARWCPNYCGNHNAVPVGDGFTPLCLLLVVYVLAKKIISKR